MAAAAHRLIATVRGHPRHVVLGAIVAGLLRAPLGPVGVLPAAAAIGAVGGGSRRAPVAAAALVAGALVSTIRLAALDAGPLAAMDGRAVTVRAIVLEPVRERPFGPAVARGRPRGPAPARGPPGGPAGARAGRLAAPAGGERGVVRPGASALGGGCRPV